MTDRSQQEDTTVTRPGPDEGYAEAAPPGEQEVVDLRDLAEAEPARPASGRPADLLPSHNLLRISGGELWDAAEAFVYDIYRQIGYCEESPRRRVEELPRWNDRSIFHAVIDDDGTVIGTVRTIVGRYSELPVGKFERTDSHLADPVCELSSLTVRTDVRSTGVIEHLYRAGWLDAFRGRSNAVVALIDEWLFDVFVDTYHLPFTVVGVAQEYMGGVPIPVALPLAGRHYVDMAMTNPEFWRWTLEAVTPDEARAWNLPTRLADGTVVVPGAATAQTKA
ncbi:N-acyl amino acid synthase FeeM domain-containing protein [Iamia sp.]|uniref:N-acyl amino acid synthase FeeM domain-containing protein n=1 Tax=Iamia sp. TaxID=2722710 RepID=UPI002C1E3579|nr:hypothetical protein [Iamia sp.]HXH56183.1 hypothetical protein [Iamia sp.]